MNKTNSIFLTIFIFFLLGLSHLSSVQGLKRQTEITRSVVLIDTAIVEKRHKNRPYTITEGVFFDKWSNKKFNAPIDEDLYQSFLKGNKKSIDMQRAVSLDMVDSTLYIGTAYRVMSILLFLGSLALIFHGFFISRKLLPKRP